MPEELSKEVVSLLQYLAPGFIVAWVFYGLTSHLKPSQFERVVQALIFTVVIQAIVFVERVALELLGQIQPLGTWDHRSTLFASIVTALLVGLIVAKVVNADSMHAWIRSKGISKRSGHPCEWFGIFYSNPRYVVLQLKDGTRVFGWPSVWPSEPDKGHFFMTTATRTVDDVEQPLDHLEGILIDVREVSFVEFAKEPTP